MKHYITGSIISLMFISMQMYYQSNIISLIVFISLIYFDFRYILSKNNTGVKGYKLFVILSIILVSIEFLFIKSYLHEEKLFLSIIWFTMFLARYVAGITHNFIKARETTANDKVDHDG